MDGLNAFGGSLYYIFGDHGAGWVRVLEVRPDRMGASRRRRRFRRLQRHVVISQPTGAYMVLDTGRRIASPHEPDRQMIARAVRRRRSRRHERRAGPVATGGAMTGGAVARGGTGGTADRHQRRRHDGWRGRQCERCGRRRSGDGGSKDEGGCGCRTAGRVCRPARARTVRSAFRWCSPAPIAPLAKRGGLMTRRCGRDGSPAKA
jgi:hypothetical protein